ncbi:Solute carrier family 35 member F6 [Fasciolopsis buskii]|uniref:Solute carrier family 35 member F6 n=1 Tax=Fasciolopsis buskii TaxID=27845 RepID=A0A8E0VED3_9TREM|nr:Solute carrier family 35 member F6 [Fasciolopsis buski]
MFLGETLCLFGFLFVRFRKRRRLERESVYREIDESERSGIINTPYVVSIFIFIFRIFNWFFILPAFCDLLGTTIAGIGLLFVDASIWQMMRGSLIIFAGILSIIFLKRRLRCYHWTGMCFTVIGLALVGTKSVFSGHSLDHTGAQSALGTSCKVSLFYTY